MRERDAEHAGADVGDTGELEQALHGPVLAERPVQHREHDVDLAEGGRHLRSGHRQRLGDRAVGLALARAELPAPVAADLDGDGLVALGVECFEHGARRGERDLVLLDDPPRRTATRVFRLTAAAVGATSGDPR